MKEDILEKEKISKTGVKSQRLLPWEESARRPWSIWDMIEHFALDLCSAVGSLMEHLAKLRSMAMDHTFSQQIDQLTDEQKAHVAEAVAEPIAREAERLGLEVSAKMAQRLAKDIQEGEWYGAETLALELDRLRESVVIELARQKFAYIPTRRAEYFEQQYPFGELVSKNFPEATKEAKDAGNCLAAELDTAAVFHLMRAAELGMRALAGERHVRLKNNISLEWAEWETLVAALEKKAAAIQNWKGRSSSKSEALEFYRGAVRELEAFKVEYRNHVMHTRKRFDEHDVALSVFSQVRAFLNRLATAGIVESHKKSIFWRKRPSKTE